MSQPRTPVSVPLAAAVVFALVVMILGGLILARRGDATTTTPSTAGALATATSEPRPTAVPTAAVAATATAPIPTAAPRPTSVPTATTQAALQATVQATLQPTVVPTADSEVSAVIALVNGTPQIFAPGAAIPTSIPPNWWNDQRPVEPALAAEVQRAFNHFWEVRVQANYDLNPEPLPQVMAGVALQREVNALDSMRSENRAAELKMDHSIQVLHAGADEAAVEDDYVSRLTYVDAVTKDPVQPTPDSHSQYAYRLRKADGVWRVVDTVRLVDE